MKIFLLLLLWLMLISMLSYFCFLTKKGNIKDVDKNSTIKKEYSEELNSSTTILDTPKEVKKEEINSTIKVNISKESNNSEENRTIEDITTLIDKNSTPKSDSSISKEENIEQNITESQDINSSLEEKLIKQYEEESSISTSPTPIIKENKSRLSLCKKRLKEILSKNKIYFYHNRIKVQKRSYVILDKIIDISKECKDSKIVIAGYTDSSGSKRNNLKISRRRANSVKEYFIKKGIKRDRLEAVGYGEANPIASNKTAKGREKNRRIEINIKGER